MKTENVLAGNHGNKSEMEFDDILKQKNSKSRNKRYIKKIFEKSFKEWKKM